MKLLKTDRVFQVPCLFLFVLIVATVLYACIRESTRPPYTYTTFKARIMEQQSIIKEQPVKQQLAVKQQFVKELSVSNDSLVCSLSENIVFVYTGRWQLLRIQLPYLLRELRSNGGVIDRVWFMMLRYDSNTRKKLTKFSTKANGVYNKAIFSLHYMGYSPPTLPKKDTRYKLPYLEILPHLMEHPHNRYFKLDDDIVYIHPGAFASVIEQDMSNCLIHFFNIAGSNWRCSWIHQHRGVYDGLNPKNLTFDYDPYAQCGWKNADCAELTLRTFLHHYRNESLDKYLFDIEYLTDKKRFSINAFLINLKMLDMAAFLASDSFEGGDEVWLTESYTGNSTRCNCVIGNALVVHFSYHTNTKKMIKRGLLKEFESIVQLNKRSFNMTSSLWHTLGYN